MSKETMSLKKKISLTLGGIVLIIMSVMTGIIYYRSADMIRKVSFQDAANLAGNNARVMEGIFNQAFDANEGLASAFKVLRKRGADRALISDMLKDVLEKNPHFIGVSSGWEPNIFDGKDAEYVNQPGHDKTGRVLFYWTRAGGIHLEPLVDYEDPEGYYEVPKRTMKPYLTEPYFYNIGGKDYYMVSAMYPIIIDGQFHGVVGIDFTMDQINSVVTKIKPYEVGYAFFCSNKGAIVAHPQKDVVGKKLSDVRAGNDQNSMSKMEKGEAFEYEETSVMKGLTSRYFHVPVNFTATEAPWSFVVSIPMDKIMEGPRSLRNYAILIGVIGLIIVVGLMVFLANRTFAPIIDMKDMMQEAAEGEADMTRRMRVGAMDEIGETAYWFNIFIERIQKLIIQVKSNSQSVSSAALQISSSTEELSKTVDDQSGQAQSVSAALSELSTTSSDIAASMEESRGITENSSQMTREGSKTIESSIDSLRQIEVQAESLSKIVKDLGQSTNQIGAIVEVINDVADQTNLLALNAAIEAARAGEHGRGFAVVADEVRKLAERTGKATDEIVAIINSLQKKAGDADSAMQETVAEVSKGTELGNKSLEMLGSIVESGKEVQNASESVAAAIEEENATISEISTNLESMAAGSMESAAAVQEVTQTADDLAREAETLKELVDQFITE